MPRPKKYHGEVVDLFCGVGALSHGLQRAGFRILAGYDIEDDCRYAFEQNNQAKFYCRDVAKLTANEIASHFTGKYQSVLAGCAPCQPFSSYKQRYDEDPQWGLVSKFAKLAAEVRPDFVTMENVPALQRYKEGRVFDDFCEKLSKAGYDIEWTIAKCEEYGVPQRRRRLVLLASKKSKPAKLTPTHETAVTVRDAIFGLPSIAAGESCSQDQLHTSASLTAINMKRIRASKPGGTWRDWPKALRAECHKRPTGKTYPGVYARMSWDDVSPTVTTQCYGYGNGRFGHPVQDRAISLREAAIIQTFPNDYKFLPAGESIRFTQVGRWIGNAVPVSLAEAIGVAIKNSKDIDHGRRRKAEH